MTSDNQKDQRPGASTNGGDPWDWQSHFPGITFGKSFRSFCTHALQPYELSDGTVIFASSVRDERERETEPDLAFYLDPMWIPACRAYHIGWRDYGLPYVPMSILSEMVGEGYQIAQFGMVEVGCIGGHGRTGTMLALFDIWSDPQQSANAVIQNVRKYYCSRAIETREQEWFVDCFRSHLLGIKPPPRPAIRKEKKKNTPKKKNQNRK